MRNHKKSERVYAYFLTKTNLKIVYIKLYFSAFRSHMIIQYIHMILYSCKNIYYI